jgi:hypothetical protein
MTHSATKKPHNRNLGVVQRLEGAELQVQYGKCRATLKLWNTTPHGNHCTGDCDWHPEFRGGRTMNARFRFDAPTQMLEVKVETAGRGSVHLALQHFNLHAEHGGGLMLSQLEILGPPAGSEEWYQEREKLSTAAGLARALVDEAEDTRSIGDNRWKVIHWGHPAHNGHGG